MIGGMVTGMMLPPLGLPVLVNLLLVITGGIGGMATFRMLLGAWGRRQKARLNVLVDKVQAVLAASKPMPISALSDAETPIGEGQLAAVEMLDGVPETVQPVKPKIKG